MQSGSFWIDEAELTERMSIHVAKDLSAPHQRQLPKRKSNSVENAEALTDATIRRAFAQRGTHTTHGKDVFSIFFNEDATAKLGR